MSGEPKRRRKRAPITPKTRRAVFERDGHRCRYCGRADRPLEIDHWIPRGLGGGNEPENLRTSCAECNAAKGSSLPAGPNPYQEETTRIMAARVAMGGCPIHANSCGQVADWGDRGPGRPRGYTFIGCSKSCPIIIRWYRDGHYEWHPGDAL